MVCQNLIANLTVIYNYLKADLIKKQRSFIIGLFSIYLVIFFITVLMNAVSLSSTIFLRILEDQVGEADLMFLPDLGFKDVSKLNSSLDDYVFNTTETRPPPFELKLIDFDDLHKRLRNSSVLKGVMPRWLVRGNATNVNENTEQWAISSLIILNSKLEIKYGMGRKVPLLPLKENECYISESMYKSLKISDEKNKDIKMRVNLLAVLKAIGINNITDILMKYYEKTIEEGENDDGDRQMNNKDMKLIKELLKQINMLKIPLNEEKVKKVFNVTTIPKTVFKKQYLESPIIKSFSLLRRMKEMIDTNSSAIINDFFIVDKEADTIQFRDFDRDDSHSRTTRNAQEVKEKFLNLNKILGDIPDELIEKLTTFELDLKINGIVPQTSGKWPSASGNVLAIDDDFFIQYAIKNVKRLLAIAGEELKIPQKVIDLIEEFIDSLLINFKLSKYALSVNGIINDKIKAYDNKSSALRRYFAKQTEKIVRTIGFDYPITISLPIYQSFASIEIAKIFLENIFIGISAFLWMLCTLLIYSLMLGNVDERTYEFGMLRALGFKKNNLIVMIIFQAFIFAIPGVFFGLLSSFIINTLIAFLLNWYVGLTMPHFLNGVTIACGIAVGFSITLISSYLPIKKALDANLKETLTLFNKKIGDLIINMIKLENYGISPSAFLSSLILIIIGFATYYIAPMSFLLMDPSIFIFIMTMILMIMLLGLIIIFQLAIPYLQQGILYLIMLCAYNDRNIHFIVRKNLEGHQKRNKKVSIMFMIALGFVIFSGCTLNLVIDFIKNLAKSAMGADAFFLNPDRGLNTINQNLVTQYFDATIKKFPGLIDDYAYISYPLSTTLNIGTEVSTLNGYPKQKRSIVSIGRNYLNAAFNDLYQVTDYDKSLNHSKIKKSKKVDLVSMLYENDNVPPIIQPDSSINFPQNPVFEKNFTNHMQINVIAAEGIKKKFAIGVDNPCAFTLGTKYVQKIPCKVVGLASKFPAFPTYSSYSTLAGSSSVIISDNQMKELIEKQMEMYPNYIERIKKSDAWRITPDGIRKQNVLLKFKEDAPLDMREMVYYELKNIVEDEGSMAMWVNDIIATAELVGEIFEYFFLVLGIIALILSFFLIWTSFYCNIKDNICEYGIMRSIGVSKLKSIRIYLYEAASIILSSIVIGTLIGIVISCTLILQFNVFAELPFVFNFPYKLYFSLIFFGFAMGLLGSFYPTYEVNQMSLVKIMKGLAQ